MGPRRRRRCRYQHLVDDDRPGSQPAPTISSWTTCWPMGAARRFPAQPPTPLTAASHWGGIPYEWMAYYFGPDVWSWPSPYADSDGSGASNLYDFLAGTCPTNAASVLRDSAPTHGPGPLPELEYAAGPHLPGAGFDESEGLDQPRRDAVCCRNGGFHVCGRQPGQLLPGAARALKGALYARVFSIVVVAGWSGWPWPPLRCRLRPSR